VSSKDTSRRGAAYLDDGGRPLAEDRLHLLDIVPKVLALHIGLDGSGKTSAVDPYRGISAEYGRGQRDGEAQALLRGEGGGIEVLQEAERALAALVDQLQVGVDVVVLQGAEHPFDASVLLEEVDGPEDGAVVVELIS